MRLRCPDNKPDDEDDPVMGCGHVFEQELDEEGLADCPVCGVFFSPAHPANQPQPAAEA